MQDLDTKTGSPRYSLKLPQGPDAHFPTVSEMINHYRSVTCLAKIRAWMPVIDRCASRPLPTQKSKQQVVVAKSGYQRGSDSALMFHWNTGRRPCWYQGCVLFFFVFRSYCAMRVSFLSPTRELFFLFSNLLTTLV